jgi:hypothetical protein
VKKYPITSGQGTDSAYESGLRAICVPHLVHPVGTLQARWSYFDSKSKVCRSPNTFSRNLIWARKILARIRTTLLGSRDYLSVLALSATKAVCSYVLSWLIVIFFVLHYCDFYVQNIIISINAWVKIIICNQFVSCLHGHVSSQ